MTIEIDLFSIFFSYLLFVVTGFLIDTRMDIHERKHHKKE